MGVEKRRGFANARTRHILSSEQQVIRDESFFFKKGRVEKDECGLSWSHIFKPGNVNKKKTNYHCKALSCLYLQKLDKTSKKKTTNAGG